MVGWLRAREKATGAWWLWAVPRHGRGDDQRASTWARDIDILAFAERSLTFAAPCSVATAGFDREHMIQGEVLWIRWDALE
jgi:hypothetical protein